MDQAGKSPPGEAASTAQKVREKLRIAKDAARIISAFRLLATQVRAYGPDHQIVAESSRQSADLIRRILHSIMDAQLEIDLTAHGFECQTVPLDVSDAKAKLLADQCRQRQVGRICLRRGVNEAELIAFVVALFKESAGQSSFGVLREQLIGLRVRNIVVEESKGEQSEAQALGHAVGDGPSSGKIGRRIPEPGWMYFALIEMVKEIMGQFKIGADLDPKDLALMTSDFVQVVVEQPGVMLPYAMLRRFDRYEFTHPVNTCILAVSVAAQTMESRHELEEMARGALLIDAGYFTPPDQKQFAAANLPGGDANHPFIGAGLLDRMSLLSKMPMVLTFEHHLGEDFSGYPVQPFRWRQNFLTAIIAVAERFDALTSEHGSERAMCPDQALHHMRENLGAALAPEALEAFMATLGPYPPGSLVELGSGELAVVLGQDAPLEVRLVTDHQRRLMDSPHNVLAPLTDDGTSPHWVRRAVDANALPLNVMDYLRE